LVNGTWRWALDLLSSGVQGEGGGNGNETGKKLKMRHLAIILIHGFRHSGINENEARSSPGSMRYILFSYLGRLLLSVSQINIEYEGVLEPETCNCLQQGCTPFSPTFLAAITEIAFLFAQLWLWGKQMVLNLSVTCNLAILGTLKESHGF